MDIEIKIRLNEKEIANEIYSLNYDKDEDCIPAYINSKEELEEWVKIVTKLKYVVFPKYFLRAVYKELMDKEINILSFPIEIFNKTDLQEWLEKEVVKNERKG